MVMTINIHIVFFVNRFNNYLNPSSGIHNSCIPPVRHKKSDYLIDDLIIDYVCDTSVHNTVSVICDRTLHWIF